MDNKLKEFIDWAIAVNKNYTYVEGMTEENYEDLLAIVGKHERIQNTPAIEREMFIAYMLNSPIFRFIPFGGTESRIYQYASQSRKYIADVEDLVVYQGFNGEYYHWVLKTVLESDIAKKRKREKSRSK
jgi:hypothetical protein